MGMASDANKFRDFPEGDNKCCTVYIVRKVIPNLGSMKEKVVAKVF